MVGVLTLLALAAIAVAVIYWLAWRAAVRREAILYATLTTITEAVMTTPDERVIFVVRRAIEDGWHDYDAAHE